MSIDQVIRRIRRLFVTEPSKPEHINISNCPLMDVAKILGISIQTDVDRIVRIGVKEGRFVTNEFRVIVNDIEIVVVGGTRCNGSASSQSGLIDRRFDQDQFGTHGNGRDFPRTGQHTIVHKRTRNEVTTGRVRHGHHTGRLLCTR